ncbi:MAG: rod shape-determining protein MreC, partial [Acidimicrobiales bacterium]|nr:rod shape-determining protein MreC [Acidimicrobiales bacterium]
MAVSRRGGRRRYILFALMLASVTLLTLDFRGFGPLASLQSGVRTVLNPLRSGAEAVFDPVGDAWRGATGYDDLQEENARLRALLDEIRGDAISEASARAELAELNALLGIEYLDEIPGQVARVIGGSAGNFESFTVELDRGSGDGIAVDMPVVTEAGLAGRVVRVDRSRSLVQLISDPDFSVGVRFANSGEVGLGHGNGDDQRTMLVDEGVSAESEVVVGEAVTTAGGRSRFPGGVPIGVVKQLLGVSAAEQSVAVDLSVDVDNLDFVTVVLFDPDAVPDAEPLDQTPPDQTPTPPD